MALRPKPPPACFQRGRWSAVRRAGSDDQNAPVAREDAMTTTAKRLSSTTRGRKRAPMHRRTAHPRQESFFVFRKKRKGEDVAYSALDRWTWTVPTGLPPPEGGWVDSELPGELLSGDAGEFPVVEGACQLRTAAPAGASSQGTSRSGGG